MVSVWGLGFRVYRVYRGSGFRVQGLGFRVPGLGGLFKRCFDARSRTEKASFNTSNNKTLASFLTPKLKGASSLRALPMGPKVVPFYGLYLESYNVIPKRNYLGAYG